jgi:cytochrome bd-type quinol oxidase subunit 2
MGRRGLAILAALLALAGIVVVFARRSRGSGLGALLGSGAFLLGIIGASAASYFPVMLRAIDGDALSITAYTGGGDEASLRIAMRWFAVGLPLVAAYFAIVFRLHRGKAVAARDGEGY